MTSTSPLPAGSCPGSAGRQPRCLFPFAFVFFFLLGRETVYEQSRRDNCSVQPLKLLPLAHDAALRKAKSYWVLTLVENLVFLERDSAMVLVDVDRVASCLRAGRAPPQPRAVTTAGGPTGARTAAAGTRQCPLWREVLCTQGLARELPPPW